MVHEITIPEAEVQPLVTTLQAVTVSSLSKTQFEKVTTVEELCDPAR
jgi:hypothetical protein